MAKIFTALTSDDIVQGSATTVTTGLWTGDVGSLATFFTSSTQPASTLEYYVNVYQANPATDDAAEVQFSIAYGHVSGGGAPTLTDSDTATLSTKATYNQFKNILLNDTQGKFIFGSYTSDHIYAMTMQRARIREKLDPGNWMVTLTGRSGSFTFIDDSSQTLADASTYGVSGRAFNIVSGTLGTGVSGSTIHSTYAAASAFGITTVDEIGFGTVYPERGVIIWNPDAIVPMVGFASASGGGAGTIQNWSTASNAPFAPFTGSLTGQKLHQYNHLALFYAIEDGADFQARSSETISSTHIFVRLKNKEYNHSNNPSLKNPTDGTIRVSDFVKKPKTYPTTIGFYNNQNELLAVAKLSRAIEKSEDKEALFRTRLDF